MLREILNLPIPLPILIVWYETLYGFTIMPEIFCISTIISYVLWRIMWRLTLGTKRHIRIMGII